MQGRMQDNQPSEVPRKDAAVSEGAVRKQQNSVRSYKRSGRVAMIIARGLLVCLFAGGLICSVTPWGQATARTTLLLPALLTAEEPLPLKVAGEPVQHTQTTVPSKNGTVYLDIYMPTTPLPLLARSRNGVLILPGVGDQRKVPQLINFSQALARTGIIAVNVTTTTLLRDEVSALDSDAVVQAFLTLAHLPGMQGQHLGIISFSAGVPLACFAAADPRIRDQVAYVAAFGGYFNTDNAIRAVGRRAVSVDGKMEKWQPVTYTVQVLANVITRNFAYNEQQRIRQAFAPTPYPLTAEEVSHLSPGARAAYHLLSGSEPDRVEQNMAALPVEVRKELAELSSSRVIGEIRAPIFLLHDRNDPFMPFTESRDFAAALERIQHVHDYVEFHIFEHVEVKSHLNIGQILNDGGRLFSVMQRVFYLGAQ
jgi:hypothetical protein